MYSVVLSRVVSKFIVRAKPQEGSGLDFHFNYCIVPSSNHSKVQRLLDTGVVLISQCGTGCQLMTD